MTTQDTAAALAAFGRLATLVRREVGDCHVEPPCASCRADLENLAALERVLTEQGEERACEGRCPCAELPPSQGAQMEQWERELAQYAHRSDSTGYAARIGEAVLEVLWQARMANAVINVAYARSISARIELERSLRAHGEPPASAGTEGAQSANVSKDVKSIP